MAEPARLPGSPPGRPSVASSPAGAAITTIAVPVTVWPAIPAPARCPASPGHLPCPRRYTSAAARAVIGALSRPGDLVAAPGRGDEVFLAAAAGAGRRGAGPDVPPPGGHCGDGTGAAALAVVTACPPPWCRPPAPAGADGTDSGLPWAACQRVLRSGGLLAVITTTVRRPGWAGQLIAHARSAGLVYVQHVVAVHAALGEDRLLSPPAPHPAAQAVASPADTRHLPVHTDLLLFGQPGDTSHD